jgi:hypothetical protein
MTFGSVKKYPAGKNFVCKRVKIIITFSKFTVKHLSVYSLEFFF